MSLRIALVLAMIAAACAIAGVIYFFSGKLKLSLAVGGVLLLTDLHFVPKMLPHVFGKRK